MTGADREPSGDRATEVRRRLRELDPARVGFLGVLSAPGYLFESLKFMRPLALCFLAFFWVWIGPLVDYALARRADGPAEPTDWIHMGDGREWLVAYLSIPLAVLNPLAMVQDLFQLAGSAVAIVRYRGSIPASPRSAYRLPVAGTWTVVNGSTEKDHSHSWFPANQRYAYDLVVTDDDGRTRPEGTDPATADYYCYDEPVLAPADGVVVDALDTDLEPARAGGFAHPLKRDIRGNYVTIQHGPEEYSCLAHLVPGSVAASPGERVARGQPVGRVGHSGNSSEPHLHCQFQDHPVFEMAAGHPPLFENVTVESPWTDDAAGASAAGPDGERPPDDATTITAGQRVTSRADEGPEDDVDGATTAGREAVAAAERAAFGVAVGGVVAFAAGLAVPRIAVGIGLAGLAVVGLAIRVLAGTDRVRRPGGLGAPLGLGLVAALWTVGPATVRSPAGLVLAGFAVYTLVATVDRYRLKRAFGTGETARESRRRAGSNA
ncbi:M23 family metallopeptidase [Saliphagus infecundisoli]|uniref:M23 family metallopeptidase n=1 Tax=Saliphagus infecundisoli TaxID=1849069 RepID=A0ABD5QFG9_9EURY|nr:M23 family metallopeptidase [Saliphagus infecundisoli]